MGFLSVLLIAISLSIDSFSVSIASSMACRAKLCAKNYYFSLMLAIFQAGMFCIGWLLAFKFQFIIESLDHWIAFGLLLVIGLHMIYEAIKKLRNPNDKSVNDYNPFKFWNVVLLSIGTSIDAMAVGVTFACALEDITAAILIFFTTLILSALGLFLGNKLQKNIKFPFEIIGGIILIIIGTKILIEHLF